MTSHNFLLPSWLVELSHQLLVSCVLYLLSLSVSSPHLSIFLRCLHHIDCTLYSSSIGWPSSFFNLSSSSPAHWTFELSTLYCLLHLGMIIHCSSSASPSLSATSLSCFPVSPIAPMYDVFTSLCTEHSAYKSSYPFRKAQLRPWEDNFDRLLAL